MNETREAAVQKVERYLFRLGVEMSNLPAAERDEHVREIRAHILDSVDNAKGSLEDAVDAVLNRLGTPEQLAADFDRESSLVRASRSLSPFVWLRTTGRWALTGVEGFVAFWVAVVGYCFGAGFLLAGLFKPLFPHFFGLYVSSQTFSLNRQGAPGEHELLGFYFLPFALCVGSLLLAGTTLLLKWIVRRFGQAKQYLRGETRLRTAAKIGGA